MAQFFKASRTKKQNNRTIKGCLIEKLDHRGRGLFFHQNKPVFVDGVLPGEKLDVTIVEEKKRYYRAQLMNLVTKSEQRITANCIHYQECGGCQLQHLEQEQQIQIKQQGLISLFQRFAKCTPKQLADTIQGQPWHYRRSARFALVYDKKRKTLDMGFRQSGSKNLVEQQCCPVLVPELELLIKPLKALLNQLQAKTALGHVELVLADNGKALLLRHLKPLSDGDKSLLKSFAEKQQLYIYLQPQPNQIINLTEKPELIYALPALGCQFSFQVDDFIQVNKVVNEQMVAQALTWLDLQPADQVLDLFCGLGNFTLPIAQQVTKVVGVEGVQKMVDRATNNAQLNSLHNAIFYQADLSDLQALKLPWAQQDYNKVLLDPARAGAEQCMQFIVSKAPSHVLYVSCDPVTLARDSKQLLDSGYRLQKLGALDMFPHTEHIESMALFIRDKS